MFPQQTPRCQPADMNVIGSYRWLRVGFFCTNHLAAGEKAGFMRQFAGLQSKRARVENTLSTLGFNCYHSARDAADAELDESRENWVSV